MKTLNVMLVGQELIGRSYFESRVEQLDDCEVNVGEFSRLDQARAAVATYRPDLVVLNMTVNQRDGLEFLRTCQNWERYVPVVMLTPEHGFSSTSNPLRYGADAYLSTDEVSAETVRDAVKKALDGAPRTTSELKSLELGTYSQHNLDPLTGLKNRRGLEERIQREIDDVGSPGRGLNLLLLGLENLRDVEQQLGFEPANHLLKRVSQVLSQAIEKDHLAVRYDNSRFGVLYAGPNYEAAADKAASMLRSLRYTLKEFTNNRDFENELNLRADLVRHRNHIDEASQFLRTARERYDSTKPQSVRKPLDPLRRDEAKSTAGR